MCQTCTFEASYQIATKNLGLLCQPAVAEAGSLGELHYRQAKSPRFQALGFISSIGNLLAWGGGTRVDKKQICNLLVRGG